LRKRERQERAGPWSSPPTTCPPASWQPHRAQAFRKDWNVGERLVSRSEQGEVCTDCMWPLCTGIRVYASRVLLCALAVVASLWHALIPHSLLSLLLQSLSRDAGARRCGHSRPSRGPCGRRMVPLWLAGLEGSPALARPLARALFAEGGRRVDVRQGRQRWRRQRQLCLQDDQREGRRGCLLRQPDRYACV